MRAVINQSNYLPWKGYFDLIHDADLFIFLDDVQFTKNDWRNRNRIKGPNGLLWLSIPVGSALGRKVNEVPLPGGAWRQKHWKTLEQSYRKSPYFERYRGFFHDIYHNDKWGNLSELNQHLIGTIASEFLGISTKMIDSSTFTLSSTGQDRVLELLKSVGASSYVSGPAAQAYLDPERFAREGIELIWKDYSGYPEYPQPHPPFAHNVSIVDLLFCVGPEAPHYIWGRKSGSTA